MGRIPDMETNCPSHDILTQFVEATLSDTETGEVVAHLDHCASCEQFVEQLERNSDESILASLRELKNGVEYDDSTMPDFPRQIGQYEILQKIGHGGMGVVYRAVHRHLKREVAMKVIRHSHLADSTSQERFVREMQSLGQLSHPNIVQATDAGIDGDHLFLVMELLDGEDLGAYIAKHGKMSVKQAVDCLRQAAKGLAFAHDQGYVHRDIKPSNLFLTRDGVVKILDLGIARSADENEDHNITQTGFLVGSPEFMAPEQFRGGTADVRSDIFSLGQTFHYLRTGNLLADEFSGMPPAIQKVLAKMTAGVPEQRFHDVNEVIAALDTAVKKFDKKPWTVIGIAVVILLILATVSFVCRFPRARQQAEIAIQAPIEETVKESRGATLEHFNIDGNLDVKPFDITNTSEWDNLFENFTRHYASSLESIVYREGYFTVFRILNQMEQGKIFDQIFTEILERPVSGDTFRQAKTQISYLHVFAAWERAIGNNEKADNYQLQIEEFIDSETSELKKSELRSLSEGRNNRYRLPRENYVTPRSYKELILQGSPSIKEMCDAGNFQEAIIRYFEIQPKITLESDVDQWMIYEGYGLSYVVSRMIEAGDLEGANQIWQDTPCSAPMSFGAGCILALGYLKANRKSEAQAIWDKLLNQFSSDMNSNKFTFLRERVICAALESLDESGLYEYIKQHY